MPSRLHRTRTVSSSNPQTRLPSCITPSSTRPCSRGRSSRSSARPAEIQPPTSSGRSTDSSCPTRRGMVAVGRSVGRSEERKGSFLPSSSLPPPSFARPLRELDFRWKGNRARREEGAPRLYSQSIEGEFAGGRARSSASLRYTVLFDHPSLSRLIESVVLAGKGPLSPPDLLCPSKDPIYPATVWVFFFFKRILHI